MTDLMKRGSATPEAFDPFARMDRWFDEWAKRFPMLRSMDVGRGMADQLIRVDEFHEDDTLVIRAEMPGIDPDEDVEVTVADRMLTIEAEHREEHEDEDRGFLRRELKRGSFSRTLALPEGVTGDDITASYRQGILEIRVPMPQPAAPEPTKVPIASGE
jgi:HSP20 family protein